MAVVALVAVLYVTISPAVDLDPTVTRASRLAALILFALAWLAQVVIHICRVQCPVYADGIEPATGPPLPASRPSTMLFAFLC